MEDKKIIHGVDVTYCLNYQPDFEEDYDVKIKHFCCENHNSCESINNQNCYFKQIFRLESRVKELEEENGELKAQRDTYVSLMNVYKNISKGRQDNKVVTDYIERLKQKLNAQFAEIEEKLTAEEMKNFELKENIKTIFTSLIIANHVDIGAIQDTIWVNTYTTLWDYIRIVLNMDDKQFEEFEKQALKQMEEVK